MTRYLRVGDIDAATEQKRHLEEKQRLEERKRENLHMPWRPKYFTQEVSLPVGMEVQVLRVFVAWLQRNEGWKWWS